MAVDLTGRVNPNGTFTISVPDGAANPFAQGGGSSPMVPAAQTSPQGYQARLPTGQIVTFASYQDYQIADSAYRAMVGSGNNGVIPTIGGGAQGSGSTGWIRTGAETVETVAGFLRGRALNQTLGEYDDSLADYDAAYRELQAPALQTQYGALLGPLLKILQAERDATIAAQTALEDELTAVDLMTGAGAAKVISQFIGNGNGNGSSSGTGTALAVGGAAVAGGLLLSNGRYDRRRRGR